MLESCVVLPKVVLKTPVAERKRRLVPAHPLVR
jgi:hypothetical protein